MARRDGQLPVIYVVNSYSYADQLGRALQGPLDRDRMSYLMSESVVGPSNPANYLPDMPFTDANDEKLAVVPDGLVVANLTTRSNTSAAR